MSGSRPAAPLLAVLLAGGILAGCQSLPRGPAAGTLADTRWRLVEFTSMDDAIGKLRPSDPALYTLDLHGDGTASMRLDCNRAHGPWLAVPAGDGVSGRFEFGPLAATQALCVSTSLHERLAKDLPFVRGFLLKEGRLHLSLMADGGVYTWEPR
jgi:hypothetical protein